MMNEKEITVYFEPIRNSDGKIERVNDKVFKAKKIDLNAAVQDETVYFCKGEDSIDLDWYDDLTFFKLNLNKEDKICEKFFLQLSYAAAKILHFVRPVQPEAAYLPDKEGRNYYFGLAEVKNFKTIEQLQFDENKFFNFPNHEQKLQLTDIEDIIEDNFINNIICNSDRNPGNWGVTRTDAGSFHIVTIDLENCFAIDYFRNFSEVFHNINSFLNNPITSSVNDDRYPELFNDLTNNQAENYELAHQEKAFNLALFLLSRSYQIENIFEQCIDQQFSYQIQVLKDAWLLIMRALSSAESLQVFIKQKVKDTEPVFHIACKKIHQDNFYQLKISMFNEIGLSFLEIARWHKPVQLPSPAKFQLNVKIIEQAPIFTIEGNLMQIGAYFAHLQTSFNQQFGGQFDWFFDTVLKKTFQLLQLETQGKLPPSIIFPSKTTTTTNNPVGSDNNNNNNNTHTTPKTNQQTVAKDEQIKVSEKQQIMFHQKQNINVISDQNQSNDEHNTKLSSPSLSNQQSEQ